MKKILMVDCETLDIGERPVLLSIGAVVHDHEQIYSKFHVGIDAETAKAHDFTVSQSTLAWWDRQSEDARAAAFSGTYHIEMALKALVNFYKENECQEIWSKGSLADIRWINNALDHFDIAKPWKYSREFCFRTLLKTVPEFEMPFEGTEHNALDDAIHQAKQFIYIRQHVQNQIQIAEDLSKYVAELEFKLLQETV
ncbi:3'-5' exonuclease [Acinetobacter sp. NigerLNRRAM0016]